MRRKVTPKQLSRKLKQRRQPTPAQKHQFLDGYNKGIKSAAEFAGHWGSYVPGKDNFEDTILHAFGLLKANEIRPKRDFDPPENPKLTIEDRLTNLENQFDYWIKRITQLDHRTVGSMRIGMVNDGPDIHLPSNLDVAMAALDNRFKAKPKPKRRKKRGRAVSSRK